MEVLRNPRRLSSMSIKFRMGNAMVPHSQRSNAYATPYCTLSEDEPSYNDVYAPPRPLRCIDQKKSVTKARRFQYDADNRTQAGF